MGIYTNIMRPVLFRMDPEDAHHLALAVAQGLSPILRRWPIRSSHPALKVNVGGMELENPVGLAAGFDKNGVLVGALGHLGFGFVEVGSVSARPCAGNPKPRLFRLPADGGLINRLGLNGDGVDVVAARLASARFSLPVGINIVKTNLTAGGGAPLVGQAALEDVLYTFERVRQLPVSYVTLNASCPNTREEMLSEVSELALLLAEIAKANSRALPVLVKLSPDSPAALVSEIVAACRRHGVAGFVCGNTTTTREHLTTDPARVSAIGAGGLSGRPLKPLALALCRHVFALKDPAQFIIGVGGVASGEDAYEFVRAGASAIELYTALVYGGPGLVYAIQDELAERLAQDGLSLSAAVGRDVVAAS